MIGFLKKKFESNAKTKMVTINRFCGYESGKAGVMDSKNSVNCDCVSGAIRSGIGLEPLLTDSGAMIDYKQENEVAQFYWLKAKQTDGSYTRKMTIAVNGSLFFYNDTDKTLIRKMLMSKPELDTVYDAQGNAYMAYVTSATGLRLYSEASGLKTTAVTKALGFCVFKDRVFAAVSPFTVAYSAPLAPTDFSETVDDSGKIYLPNDSCGKLLTIRATEEDLYVFYERGVTHLKPSGAARGFEVTRLAYNGGPIVKKSIFACRGKMVFLAQDGLYVCEGKKTRRICEKMKVQLAEDSDKCRASGCAGKYLLNYDDEWRGQVLLVLDVEKEEGYFGTYLRSLSDCDGLAVCNVDGCLRYAKEFGTLPVGAQYRFESTNQDFGIKGRKTLRAIRLKGVGSIEVTVSVDNGRVEKTEALNFINGVATMHIGARGENFAFTFVLYHYGEVSELTAELVLE